MVLYNYRRGERKEGRKMMLEKIIKMMEKVGNDISYDISIKNNKTFIKIEFHDSKGGYDWNGDEYDNTDEVYKLIEFINDNYNSYDLFTDTYTFNNFYIKYSYDSEDE